MSSFKDLLEVVFGMLLLAVVSGLVGILLGAVWKVVETFGG